MSDLKDDVIEHLYGMVEPQTKDDERMWRQECEQMADRIVDILMGAAKPEIDVGAMIEENKRLETVAKAASILCGDNHLEHTAKLIEDNESLRRQIEHFGKLASDHRDELEAEIARLESELKAAKLLVDPKAVEATNAMADEIHRLMQEHEGLRAGNMWVSAVMAAVVVAVNKRDLDEVVRICAVYENRLDENEAKGESVH